MMEAMAEVRRHVEDNFDYVGDTFAREARDIHEGRSEQRGIYGEASPAEVKGLVEDGVPARVAAAGPAKEDRSELGRPALLPLRRRWPARAGRQEHEPLRQASPDKSPKAVQPLIRQLR